MKKRVFSALLVLCMACSLVSTVWASPSTPETATPETAAPASPTPSPTPDVSAYPARTLNETVEGSGVTVQVDIPAGSLPADAQLTAELLGASTDADAADTVADVAAELDEADVDYDGFVALDISFVDAAGAKIEPLQPVSVSFSLPADLLPAEADPATLAVQHLAEDETGEVETVETVADVADETAGTVTVETGAAALSLEEDVAALPADAEVKAEFEVDGFSVFTITWDRLISGEITYNLTIRDTDGVEIILLDGQDLSFHLDRDTIYTIDQIIQHKKIQTITDVNGQQYVFQNATFIEDGIRRPIRAMQNVYVDGLSQLKVFDSVLGNNGVWTRSERDLRNCQIELVYRRIEESSSEVYEPEPTYTKQATTTDGGKTYDLALTVSGDVGERTEKLKLDVLFIVDQSGSMNEWGEPNYQEMVADCASDLATSLAGNTDLDTRFAVVTFASGLVDQQYYKDSVPRLSWTPRADLVHDAANPNSNGGTNYQAGLLFGRSALIESRPDAQKYVIFLSDGNPTYHYDSEGNTLGGSNETNPDDIGYALGEAANYSNVNGFFTISVGTDDTAGTYLDQLSNAVCDAVGVEHTNPNFVDYTARGSTELSDHFNEIQAQITRLTMKDVSITDTLSDYVEPVAGEEPYVIVKNENGDTVVTENSNYAIIYDAQTAPNVFTLDFNDEYALKQGYTYELHFKVQPTNKAYTDFAATDYNATGEAETGTYALQSGFYSNVENSAKLTYATDIDDYELDYPMPVIKVPSTSLTINKTMSGLDNNLWDTAAAQITFTVKDVATINLGATPPENANYTITKTDTGFQVVVTGLTVTKSYTVTETCNKLEGYNVTTTIPETGSLVTMSRDATSNVLDVTNTYTPDNQLLTISKTVTGEMGSYEKDFAFTLTLHKEGDNQAPSYYDQILRVVYDDETPANCTTIAGYEGGLSVQTGDGANGHTYGFDLSHSEQIVIEVPYGYTATVNEDRDGYTATVTVDGTEQSPNQTQAIVDTTADHSIAYENHLDPVAPTGLESNHTTPYVLMITAAGMAGLVLIGGIVARRIRRRRRQE